jgi:hypothetical protein
MSSSFIDYRALYLSWQAFRFCNSCNSCLLSPDFPPIRLENIPRIVLAYHQIPAFAAILGSTVGGLTTFATTFLNQRYMARRDMLEKDVANREKLYSEFLTEVADLFDLSAPRPREQAGTACLQ